MPYKLILKGIINRLSTQGHTSFISRVYNQLDRELPFKINVVYEFADNMLDADGDPTVSSSSFSPDGFETFKLTIRLDQSFFANTSEEWVTSVILHEMAHGIVSVYNPELTTNKSQHIFMFDEGLPIEIRMSLQDLFPNETMIDLMGLSLDGLGLPGLYVGENETCQQLYGLSIEDAKQIFIKYRNSQLGDKFCP